MARIWDDVIPEDERGIWESAGYGRRGEFGRRPALLVVDVSYDFTGDRREPIRESQKRFHNSCGEAAWDAIEHIRTLLAEARARDVPVFYTSGPQAATLIQRGGWLWKNARGETRVKSEISRRIGMQIVEEIAPAPGELVIEKTKPAAFYGTPLASYLTLLGVDDLIVCGTATSGCVRATVIEAFNLNYHVQVVEECTFDRGDVTHRVNLFDMNNKYGDVLPLAEVTEYLRGLPVDTFADVERYRADIAVAAGAAGR